MSSITPGTKGYIHRPKASYLSRPYTAVTVVDVKHHTISVVVDSDPDAQVHEFSEHSRSDHKGTSRTLILEGEPRYPQAVARAKYDDLTAHAGRLVSAWSHDEANPGKALQASEALRVLASTPEPPKD